MSLLVLKTNEFPHWKFYDFFFEFCFFLFIFFKFLALTLLFPNISSQTSWHSFFYVFLCVSCSTIVVCQARCGFSVKAQWVFAVLPFYQRHTMDGLIHEVDFLVQTNVLFNSLLLSFTFIHCSFHLFSFCFSQ